MVAVFYVAFKKIFLVEKNKECSCSEKGMVPHFVQQILGLDQLVCLSILHVHL